MISKPVLALACASGAYAASTTSCVWTDVTGNLEVSTREAEPTAVMKANNGHLSVGIGKSAFHKMPEKEFRVLTDADKDILQFMWADDNLYMRDAASVYQLNSTRWDKPDKWAAYTPTALGVLNPPATTTTTTSTTSTSTTSTSTTSTTSTASIKSTASASTEKPALRRLQAATTSRLVVGTKDGKVCVDGDKIHEIEVKDVAVNAIVTVGSNIAAIGTGAATKKDAATKKSKSVYIETDADATGEVKDYAYSGDLAYVDGNLYAVDPSLKSVGKSDINFANSEELKDPHLDDHKLSAVDGFDKLLFVFDGDKGQALASHNFGGVGSWTDVNTKTFKAFTIDHTQKVAYGLVKTDAKAADGNVVYTVKKGVCKAPTPSSLAASKAVLFPMALALVLTPILL